MVKIKRAYDTMSNDDGYRILVDRLWPRGVTKEEAHINEWMKEIAPSPSLRTQFHENKITWEVFCTEYTKELHSKKELLGRVKQCEREHKVVCLVFAAKDREHNNAVLLQSVLEKM